MRSEIITAAGIVAVAIGGVRVLDMRDSAGAQASAPVAVEEQRASNRTSGRVASVSAGLGSSADVGGDDEIRISASLDQQFYVNAEVNRRPARFLIDTGASYVALRDSDARAAGIYTSWTDYNYPVHTANGETKAAFVTIDEIEIDGIRINGVKAFILSDDQLNINLLGMSFLSRLESVEARKGVLVLRG